jgi:hypothetical protein
MPKKIDKDMVKVRRFIAEQMLAVRRERHQTLLDRLDALEWDDDSPLSPLPFDVRKALNDWEED